MDHDVAGSDRNVALAALAHSHLGLRLLAAMISSFPQRERERVRAGLSIYERELTVFEGRVAEGVMEELPENLPAVDVPEVRRIEIAAIQLMQRSIPF